jgi:hypothetical protein
MHIEGNCHPCLEKIYTALMVYFFFFKSLYTKVNETKGGLLLSHISLEIEDLVSYAVPPSRKGDVNEYITTM